MINYILKIETLNRKELDKDKKETTYIHTIKAENSLQAFNRIKKVYYHQEGLKINLIWFKDDERIRELSVFKF